jgi:hypothetical protein
MLELQESALQGLIYPLMKGNLPADIPIENCGGADDEEPAFIGLHADKRMLIREQRYKRLVGKEDPQTSGHGIDKCDLEGVDPAGRLFT